MGSNVSHILLGAEGDLAMHRINAFFGDLKQKQDGEEELKKFMTLEDVQELLGEWMIPEPQNLEQASMWIMDLEPDQTKSLNDIVQIYLGYKIPRARRLDDDSEGQSSKSPSKTQSAEEVKG